MLLAERHESERLRQIIKELQRHRFGRKADTLPEEQMLLGLEDVQQVATCTKPAKTKQLRKAGRSAHASAATIAEHCRRICRGSRLSSISTTRPAPAARATCTRSARTRASGWTWCRRSSALSSPDVPNAPAEPAKMASCRPTLRLIEGGLPTEATVAQVLVSKMPIICRSTGGPRSMPPGHALDRSTLADWVGPAAFLRCFAQGPSCSVWAPPYGAPNTPVQNGLRRARTG